MVEFITLFVIGFVACRVLFGNVQFAMPNLDIKLFDIVDHSPETIENVEVSVREDKPNRQKKRKEDRPKRRKKCKKLSILQEECVLALVGLGVKKSEALNKTECVFNSNGHIKSVSEFIEISFKKATEKE